MTKFCFALIFILAGCFHVTAARRELKSTLTSDSSIYSTLSSEDQPPSALPSTTHRFPHRRRALKEAANTTTGRIANGQEVSPGQFPFVIYFDVEGGTCSGSIIAPRVILTAGHCVWDTEVSDFVDKTKSHIYFGSTEYDYTDDAGEIKGFFVPTQYDPDAASSLGDVALIELAEPIPSSIKPVALANAATKMPAGTTVTVAGWGEMENGKMPQHLMYTTGTVLSTSECDVLSNAEFDYDVEVDHFCVGVPQNNMQTTCGGDSGGPYFLVQNGKSPVQA